MKVTGAPLNWIFFKRKVYYENRSNQKRKIKGGALFVTINRFGIIFLSSSYFLDTRLDQSSLT